MPQQQHATQVWREGLAYAALTVLFASTVGFFASTYEPRLPMNMEPPAVIDLDPAPTAAAPAAASTSAVPSGSGSNKGRRKKNCRRQVQGTIEAVTLNVKMKGKKGITHNYTETEDRAILREYKKLKGDTKPADGPKGWYGLVASNLRLRDAARHGHRAAWHRTTASAGANYEACERQPLRDTRPQECSPQGS